MSGVKCSGTELSLAHCHHDGEDVACPQGGVQYGAGVACSESESSWGSSPTLPAGLQEGPSVLLVTLCKALGPLP